MLRRTIPSVLMGTVLVCAGPPELEKTARPKVSARVPEIFSVNPSGARRGGNVRVEILGENLDSAAKLEFGAKGVDAKIIESSYLRAVAEVAVSNEAEVAIGSLRLLSPLGVSNPLGFRVGDLPEVAETEPNDGRDKAQAVSSPVAVDAVLFPDEDTDFFRFHARAGERLRLEVLAARNGSGLNAEMYLLDSSGLRIAVGDDEERTDPVIEHTFRDEGEYFAVVRGVFSVLNISFPTGHPAYTYQFKLAPWEPAVTSASAVEEKPDRLQLPGEVRGTITKAGEKDSFGVQIDEPGAYVFEVQTPQDSLLDPVLILYDSKGAELAKKDGPGDSRIYHKFAEAGEYRVEVRQAVLDLHGPLYSYRLLGRKAQPGFSLTAVGGNDATPWVRSADRLVAHRGMEITLPVTVEWLEDLEKLDADIELTVEGLPPAVSSSECWARVKDGKLEKSRFTARVEIPLSIAADAVLGTYPIRIKGKAKAGDKVLIAEEKVVVSATGRYVMSATGGFPNPGQQRYLSIVEPVDFALRPEIGDERYPVRFTMQPGTNKTLLLSVLPPENFVADVQFTTEGLPRGLMLQHVEPRPDSKQYLLHLKAAPDCEVGWFPIVTFIAHPGGAAIPTPYFGISVQ